MLLNYKDNNRGSEFASVRFGHYTMTKTNINIHTNNLFVGWVVRGFYNLQVADKKATKILINNLPIKKIIKHVVAARMYYRLTMADINSLRDELYKLKS